MGLFRRRSDDGAEILRAMAESAVRRLQFQLDVLRALKGRPVAWDDNGNRFEGTATGDYLGPAAGVNAGMARFVLSPGGADKWEYPTRVAATGRYIDTGQSLKDVTWEILGINALIAREEGAAAPPAAPPGSSPATPAAVRPVPEGYPLGRLTAPARQALLGAPQGLAALRPVLATADATSPDDVEAKRSGLAFHLQFPSDAVDEAIRVLVGIAFEESDLDLDYDWLALGVEEGWRAGRRLLGSDVSPYPYEERGWSVPDDMITRLSERFGALSPGQLVPALGADLVAALEAVVDVLCRHDPQWAADTASRRSALYRTAVWGGVGLAVAEFEVLADYTPPADGPPRGPALSTDPAAHEGRPTAILRPWVTQDPAGPVDDVGPAVLAQLAGDLQIDDEWAVREPRALTWWSQRLPQTFRADEPRLSLGDATVAVRATTPIVINVSADDDAVREALLVVNRTAALGSLVYDPDARQVLHSTTAYFHAGNRDVIRVFGLAAVLGNYEAHERAELMAALLHGQPAERHHPLSGSRPVPDGMLLIGPEVRRLGDEPSQFAGPVFGALPGSPYVPWVLATGDDEALTGEFAFNDDAPAMVGAASGRGPGTALVQIDTTVRHPAYGHGALMLLRLPLAFDADEAGRLACGLNWAETTEWTGFPQFGAWATDPTAVGTLTHAAFLPNYAAPLGLFPLVTFYEWLRCSWAAERLTTRTATGRTR